MSSASPDWVSPLQPCSPTNYNRKLLNKIEKATTWGFWKVNSSMWTGRGIKLVAHTRGEFPRFSSPCSPHFVSPGFDPGQPRLQNWKAMKTCLFGYTIWKRDLGKPDNSGISEKLSIFFFSSPLPQLCSEGSPIAQQHCGSSQAAKILRKTSFFRQ